MFITHRGNPSHVLITMDAYIELTGKASNIVELLAMNGEEIDDFEPVRLSYVAKPADLT